jgi:peptide/nickel transport system permease protein
MTVEAALGDVTVPATDIEVEAKSPLRGALHTALRRPLVVLSVAWLALVIVVSIFAGQLSPYDPTSQDIFHLLRGPSGAHLLGTDDLGRDILSRLMHGGGLLLATSLESVLIGVLIGVPLGMFAGYAGGKMDSVTSFLVNVLLAIPGFVILVAMVVISGNNLVAVMAVLGLLFSANFYRLVRSTTQASRSLPYVDSARVAGLARVRIMFRHVLPNVTGPLVVQVFLTYTVALIVATSLAFLGLGVSPQTPSWGQMVYDATQNLASDPWMMVPIGAVLIFTALAANFIGSAIRDALPHAQRQRLLVNPHAKRRPAPVVPTAAGLSPQPDAPVTIAADDAPLLEVDGLTVSFPGARGEQAVVDRVSFGVPRGTTLGLVGESGCGKTITALAILGLVPPPGQISAGRILLDGQDLAQLSERQRAELRGSKIALVSQEPMVALDPCFTIGSQLREPLRLHRKLTRNQAEKEALDLLRLVGIARPESVAKSYPHQVSGGMAQRVAIAIALTGEPELLIADEPTTALDVTIQAEILDLLRSLQDKLGMTVVIVTHDLGVVADFCQTVVVMYAGQVIEVGTAEEVLVRPAHPYTRALLGAVPDVTQPGQPLTTVKGTVPLPKDWPAWCRFADRCEHAVAQCRSGPIPLEAVQPDRVVRCVRAAELLGVQR